MKSLANRTGNLKMHYFAWLSSRITELVAEGREIIRLDEGSPDLPPPPEVIQTLNHSASRPDSHRYQPHRGPKRLRQAWSRAYARRGVTLDPEREVLPLLGSKEGIYHFSHLVLDPGDMVLVPDPGYITYTRGAQMAGAQVVYFPLSRERNWLPDLGAIPDDVLKRVKLLWLNYPNNPTGAVATLDLFRQAVNLAQQYGFILCHDAAYLTVAFDGERPPSLLEVDGAKEVGVEFNSLSKSHNMAGWRSAAVVGNADLIQAFHRLKTNVDSGGFLPVLEASAAALEMDYTWVEQRNLIYWERRDALVSGLQALDLDVPLPRASLYVWSPVPASWDETEFARQALEQAGVSLTPGSVFGDEGAGYVRISITAPLEQVQEAVRRLQAWKDRGGFEV